MKYDEKQLISSIEDKEPQPAVVSYVWRTFGQTYTHSQKFGTTSINLIMKIKWSRIWTCI